MAARAEADPGRLLVLLGSNRQPALHLGLALEALDRIAPVLAELGRTVAPAVGGPGRYENRLVLCRAPPGPPAAVDRRLKALERRLAPRRGERDCPLDLDPFLLLREGRAEAFARTPKVLALLSRLDPVGRLGLDPVLRAGPPLE